MGACGEAFCSEVLAGLRQPASIFLLAEGNDQIQWPLVHAKAPAPGSPAFLALFSGGVASQEDTQRLTLVRCALPHPPQAAPETFGSESRSMMRNRPLAVAKHMCLGNQIPALLAPIFAPFEV